MPVICAACHTENREHAMFCRGCAGKLPAFAATGPSVLEVMKSQRDADTPGAGGRRATDGGGALPLFSAPILSAEMRTFWLRLGLVMAVVMLAFVGWSSYVTRKVPMHGGAGPDIGVPFDSAAAGVPPRSAVTTVVVVPPVTSSPAASPSTLALPPTVADTAAAAAPASDTTGAPASANSQAIAAAVAAAAAPPMVAAPSTPILPTAPTAPTRTAPIALSASLSPGESALPAVAESRRPPATPRHELRSAPPVRVAGADPRRGCEGLNFIFAAHCEATHCDEAAFSANPRCDAVRAQRQRDLARRNLEF